MRTVKTIGFALICVSLLFGCASTYNLPAEPVKRTNVEIIEVNAANVAQSKYFEVDANGQPIEPVYITSPVITIDQLKGENTEILTPVESSAKVQAEIKSDIQAAIDAGKEVNPVLDDSTYGETSGKIAKNATDNAFTYISSSWQYQNALAVYDYVDGKIYEIITSPNAITDFRLQPGEEISGEPIVDRIADQWQFVMGTSYDGGQAVQHLFIKPLFVGLDTSMIILTNMRTYYFRVASFNNTYMTALKFKYPGDAGYANGMTTMSTNGNGTVSSYVTKTQSGYQMDMSNLSYAYKIMVYKGNPTWRPQAVFSDRIKTCIQYPVMINFTDQMPSVYVVRDGKETLVNYRIIENLCMVDTVITGNQYFLLKGGEGEQIKILTDV